ncbi:ATP-binding protein [Pleionea sediminis]|uniref:ATP-binding protein n=1 Tax=Pleionea sediminis TaxID=2569479 RepID=UPI001184762C|nr:ATP-binding protein [Pleionea sediminis]
MPYEKGNSEFISNITACSRGTNLFWLNIPFDNSSIKASLSFIVEIPDSESSSEVISALTIATQGISLMVENYCHIKDLDGLLHKNISSFDASYLLKEVNSDFPIVGKSLEEPVSRNETHALINLINSKVHENRMLHRELKIKTVLIELAQFYAYEGDELGLFNQIFLALSSIVKIDSFYIAFKKDNILHIPYYVDKKDHFTEHQFSEAADPKLSNSLISYAIERRKSLSLTEEELRSITKEKKLIHFDSIPKQWCFTPFRIENTLGGICVRSYKSQNHFHQADIALLNLFALHIGNLLQLRNTQKKVKEQVSELQKTQVQLVQSEKMASIGQLAAGVAHEINNPLGYVNSNLNSLKNYISDLNRYLAQSGQLLSKSESFHDTPLADDFNLLFNIGKDIDIQFIQDDLDELIKESIFGMKKVKDIVQSLKDFSRVSQEEEAYPANINDCIRQTIKIVWNDLKYKCEVIEELRNVPDQVCYPGQLNQVIMNLLVNAGHAIEEKGTITIKTYDDKDNLYISIKDTGKGIPEDNLERLFEPFFTTKPIGQGTGLGLSISYGIIKKHKGDIKVSSQVGVGTEFLINLPKLALKQAVNST